MKLVLKRLPVIQELTNSVLKRSPSFISKSTFVPIFLYVSLAFCKISNILNC